jgi:hypothetical protein
MLATLAVRSSQLDALRQRRRGRQRGERFPAPCRRICPHLPAIEQHAGWPFRGEDFQRGAVEGNALYGSRRQTFEPGQRALHSLSAAQHQTACGGGAPATILGDSAIARVVRSEPTRSRRVDCSRRRFCGGKPSVAEKRKHEQSS